MASAMVGNRIYVVGGNVGGKPSNRVFSINIDSLENSWREEKPMLGFARTQPVAVSLKKNGEDCLFVFGGFAAGSVSDTATLSTETLMFQPTKQMWSKAATPTDNGEMVSLGGGGAYSLNDTLALVIGGVNKDIFLEALKRERNLSVAFKQKDSITALRLKAEKKAYMEMQPEDYRLNDRLLVYNSTSDRWTKIGHAPQSARAGAAFATFRKDAVTECYQIGGETKPGIRTPEAWIYRIKP